ncbi:sensor histidine kinase [Hufsiella ginkgonis]|uniref:histidine kinase n=1 Tax=Hufsiella ginkgonis TaxID=2695274 RepID=A0A7K1Y0A2_9SPHI|nr:PAS domain S-box protein [Hufsiella ginkgonis]MXV16660.1 PAS domain S-box protein [Hufsiella ginkgonis]
MDTDSLHELFTFKSIFEGLEDAVICHDLDQNISNWNPAAERLFGYTKKEMMGKTIFSLMSPEYHTEQEQMIKDLLQGGAVNHFYTVRRARTGKQIPVFLTLSPIRDKNENIIGVSQIVRNVTKEKETEQQQAVWSAIIEGSEDAVISKTLDGIIITWNKGAENIFGYTEKEAIGKHISLLIAPDRLAEEDRIIASIKRGEKVDHYQTVRIRKDGAELQVSLTVSPIRDGDGEIIGASKIARDITAYIQAEQALEKKAKQLLILNSIGKNISEKLDVNAILQKVTDATTNLTGAAFGAFFYNKVNSEGESYMLYTLSGVPREAFAEFPMPRNTAVFHATFSGEGVVRADDITKDPRYGKNDPHFGMPKGHLPVVSYLAVPVLSSSGTVIGGLFFGHPQPGVFLEEHEDMVVNVASQAAIALDNSKLFEEVSELSRKKDEFIALAAHELKTPLTSMSGFLQILQKNDLEGINKMFVEKSVRQLEKLTVLVNDLFDISKVQAGKLQFNFELFDLSLLIEEICETFKHSVPGREFITVLEPRLIVKGDKMRMEQVITNLVANAVKYAPGSPKIDITAAGKQNEIIVCVKDYGPGISRENQAYIFTQFYRVTNDEHHVSGLGLGLYITREIIKRHGGRIWVESEPGNGASFIFAVPQA